MLKVGRCCRSQCYDATVSGEPRPARFIIPSLVSGLNWIEIRIPARGFMPQKNPVLFYILVDLSSLAQYLNDIKLSRLMEIFNLAICILSVYTD